MSDMKTLDHVGTKYVRIDIHEALKADLEKWKAVAERMAGFLDKIPSDRMSLYEDAIMMEVLQQYQALTEEK